MAGSQFGVKSLELIKELKRCDTASKGSLPNYNEKILQDVFEEMGELFEHNKRDVGEMSKLDDANQRIEMFSAVKMRHYGLIRNHRCVMAYLTNRLKYIKSLRWGFGTSIPADIRNCMSEAEFKWFETYNKHLFTYMKSTAGGIDLCIDRDPPKHRCITVRCLKDHGDLILTDGSRVVLKRGLQHHLPRQDCEHLIRIGVLEHLL